MSETTLHPFDELERHQRDELGRCIRHAARLASLLAVTPHHPDLLVLLRDLVIDVENLWLILGEDDDQEDDPS